MSAVPWSDSPVLIVSSADTCVRTTPTVPRSSKCVESAVMNTHARTHARTCPQALASVSAVGMQINDGDSRHLLSQPTHT